MKSTHSEEDFPLNFENDVLGASFSDDDDISEDSDNHMSSIPWTPRKRRPRDSLQETSRERLLARDFLGRVENATTNHRREWRR
jgi:hypothetical protein